MTLKAPSESAKPTHDVNAITKAVLQGCGTPDLLAVDNGTDLTSYGVRDACSALGIDLLFTPVRSPWYKGTIERAGRTLNTRFIHWLPGTTLGKPTSDVGYDGSEEAVLTLEVFDELLHQYFATIHNKTPRRDKEGSPERRYFNGIRQWPIRLPTSMDEFNAAVALTRRACLQQTGLRFLGLQYQNDDLGRLWNRMPPGQRLTFKVNPLDLQTIHVLCPPNDEVLAVNCVSDFAWPRSLAYHVAVRAQATLDNLNPDERRDLAIAERQFMQRMTDAVTQSKKTLRRMQANLYREAQKSGDLAETAEEAPASTAGHEQVDGLLDEVFDDA